MKYLSLYIDKWYMVGAITDESGSYPLRLSNQEERIWLYFYNNTTVNSVAYGLSYRDSANAGELNYYCDIFKLIPSSEDKTYKSYGFNTEIRKIFADAGMFSDLRSGFDDNKPVPIYVSFSIDISLSAQSVFLDVLKENNFDVLEYVADIETLALERLRINHNLTKQGYVLVANACNENLHYSLYKPNKETFERIIQKHLNGYGSDLRKHALLLQVIENINCETNFLNESEKESELRYLSKYVDYWLRLLDETPLDEPTPLGFINLKKQKGNKYSVSVLKKEIDNRTDRDTENIVREMTKMIRDNHVGLNEISEVVFIGDTFGNNQFKRELDRHLIDARYIHLKENELANIVSIYTEIPDDRFETAESDFKQKSEAELNQAFDAKKRREEIAAAKRQDEETKIANAEKIQSEKNLETILDRAEDAVKNEDYSSAVNLYKNALVLSPENQYIQEKIDYLSERIAEIKTKQKQYNDYIEAARVALEAKNWEEAKTQSQMALNVKPKSEKAGEAEKILRNASAMQNKYNRLKECLIKVDTFIEQKEYYKAKKEIDNIDLLGITDSAIEDRRNVVQNAIEAIEETIKSHKTKLDNAIQNKRYEEAINICNLLVELDSENTRNWTEKLERLKQQVEKLQEQRKHLESIKQKIDEADFHDQYEEVIKLCQDYLAICKEQRVSRLLEKAEKNLAKQNHEREGRELVNKVKADISDGNFEEAECSLRNLCHDHPELANEVKSLNKRLFEEQEKFDKSNTREPARNPVGFMQPGTDDFFNSEPQPNNSTKQNKRKKNPATPKISDDFFDEHQSDGIKSTSKRIDSTTNNDFNF